VLRQSTGTTACAWRFPAHPENLLVLYLDDAASIAEIAERIAEPPATPANPYWARPKQQRTAQAGS
jgi:hypothetical protein